MAVLLCSETVLKLGELGDNKGAGTNAVFEALAKKIPDTLEELRLNFSSTPVGDTGLNALSAHVKTLKHFHLTLAGSHVHDASALVEAVAHMKRYENNQAVYIDTGFAVYKKIPGKAVDLDAWLRLASSNDDVAMVRGCIHAWADPLTLDALMRTPYRVAQAHNYSAVMEVLQTHGGNPSQMELMRTISGRNRMTFIATIVAGILGSIIAFLVSFFYTKSHEGEAKSKLVASEGALALAASHVASKAGCLASWGPHIARSCEVFAAWVLPCSLGFYFVRPEFWIPFLCVAYLPAAFVQHGFDRLYKDPILIAVSVSDWRWRLFSVLRTALILAFLGFSWGWIEWDLKELQDCDLEATCDPDTLRFHSSWVNPDGPAIVGAWPNDLRPVWTWLMGGVIALSVVWVLVGLGSIIYSLVVPGGYSAWLRTDANGGGYAGEVNSLAKEIDQAKGAEQLPVDIKPVSKFAACKAVFLFVLDIFTDFNGVLTLVITGRTRSAVALSFICCWTLTQQVVTRTCICNEAAESLRRGFYTDKWLNIQRLEAGFESFFSIAVTVLAFPYANITAWAFFTGMISVLNGIHSSAGRAHMELDLLNQDAGVGVEDAGSSPREEGALLQSETAA